jgi:glycosyltransferase involved in cell wall biosynthesis
MSAPPKLSYIVLSYNYERYIGVAIQSILDQTHQDFEIIVVDDASRDRSVETIKGFDDPRIRLLINEKNRGGAGSYNRAVEACVGEWLVNVDADDWIAPEKAEAQLRAVSRDPRLDIVGTYVNWVDEHGSPVPDASAFEAINNTPTDLNWVDSWIGVNPLCRSSTMVSRASHLRIGLDDPAMVRAPDYELWTRALRCGCKFSVLPEKLTYCRFQPKGVTYGDPVGTMLEMAYSVVMNLIPLAEIQGQIPSLTKMLSAVALNSHLSELAPNEAYRLVGIVMTSHQVRDFSEFRELLSVPNPSLERVGLRTIRIATDGRAVEVRAYIEARDFWHQNSLAWEREWMNLSERVRALDEERSAWAAGEKS